MGESFLKFKNYYSIAHISLPLCIKTEYLAHKEMFSDKFQVSTLTDNNFPNFPLTQLERIINKLKLTYGAY